MIQIYEVYIDLYLIENAVMDAQLLLLALLLLKERIVPWRLFAASLAGGTGAVVIFLSGVRFGLWYIVPVILLDALMLMICMKGIWRRADRVQRIALGIIYLHGMAFAHTRLMECAGRIWGGLAAHLVSSAVIAGIAAAIVYCRRIKRQQRIYDVRLTENGEDVELRALFDTGNLLTDPISGKPVSVIEESEAVRQWIAKYPQKYKAIPYQSIGNEHGILEGIVVDELRIWAGEEQVIKKETIVALYQGKLSKDGAFQMILNHSLI